MLTKLLRWRKTRLHGDEGVAIILVVSVSVIVTALMVTLMSYTITSVAHARKEQDYQAALSAAQAGVDDYLARLNSNNVYWQSTDCSNTAMRKAFAGPSPVCGWGSGTPVGWVPVAGAQTPTGASCATLPTPVACTLYHYDVDSSGTIANGAISVTATGRSKAVNRSVRVSVRRQSFGDYLYFTDYETVDPANPFVYGANNTYAEQQCTRHYWDNPPRNSGCQDINFVTGDSINGPLHSNDAILMSGTPTFNGPVTTAYPSCRSAGATAPPAANCYRANGSASPTFAKGISYANVLPLPASNGALQAQTVAGTAIGSPGCAYTGPTRIHFNSGGTMTVWSPYTRTVNPGCGSAPFNSSAQTVPVPSNNVIFIQPVPSGQSSPPDGNCASGSIGSYPQAGDVNYDYGEYVCRDSTLFVDGALSGRVTIGATNIIVVGNLTYAGGPSGGDSLGLIAANSVEVYHPVQCTSYDWSGCGSYANMNRPDGSTFTNPTIQAAILSLQHSFTVQLYSLGTPMGTLSILGSVAQKFRGAVGTGGSSPASGYLKSYVYDTRLKFAPPPFYLNPVQAKYISAVFAEVAPAY